MARQIFIVDAHIVDKDGNFHFLDNYPKKFDSKSYSGDVDKAKRRAEGDASDVWGDMCKVDERQIQTVSLYTVDGFLLESKTMGQFPSEEPNE